MVTIIRSIAREKDFFPRPDIRDKILNRLKRGENLLLSALRRTGNSPILMDFIDNSDENKINLFLFIFNIDKNVPIKNIYHFTDI